MRERKCEICMKCDILVKIILKAGSGLFAWRKHENDIGGGSEKITWQPLCSVRGNEMKSQYQWPSGSLQSMKAEAQASSRNAAGSTISKYLCSVKKP